jgi:hypothetical protein
VITLRVTCVEQATFGQLRVTERQRAAPGLVRWVVLGDVKVRYPKPGSL